MEWLNILIEQHPRIFDGKGPLWSDLPEGWFKLLDALCTGIESALTAEQLRDFRVTQIKEKYGGLRFYYSGGNDLVDGLIESAENRSESICVQCGDAGKKRSVGWVVTMCDFCTGEQALLLAGL